MAENELKPCPFCGGTNISSGEVLGREVGDLRDYKQTSCLTCGADGPKHYMDFPDIYDNGCDGLWNQRPTEADNE